MKCGGRNAYDVYEAGELHQSFYNISYVHDSEKFVEIEMDSS